MGTVEHKPGTNQPLILEMLENGSYKKNLAYPTTSTERKCLDPGKRYKSFGQIRSSKLSKKQPVFRGPGYESEVHSPNMSVT